MESANSFETKLKREVRQKAAANGGPELIAFAADDCKNKVPTTCIESKEVAERVFTAKYLFILNKCKKAAAEDLRFISSAEYNDCRKKAAEEFNALYSDLLDLWEMKRRAHLLQWEHIPSRITEALTQNPKWSWSGIEHDLEYWCSATTIRCYLTTRVGYRLYAERIIPSLSTEQKVKHLTFAHNFLTGALVLGSMFSSTTTKIGFGDF